MLRYGNVEQTRNFVLTFHGNQWRLKNSFRINLPSATTLPCPVLPPFPARVPHSLVKFKDPLFPLAAYEEENDSLSVLKGS